MKQIVFNPNSNFVPKQAQSSSSFSQQLAFQPQADCQQQSLQNSFQSSSNPFQKPSTISGEFRPTCFQPQPFQPTYQPDQPSFSPQAAYPCQTEPSSSPAKPPKNAKVDADGKYKTEMCKNWIETGHCRYEFKCRFAHGQQELTQAALRVHIDKYKSKNCRTFHLTKQCLYGVRCIYSHEHRSLKQLHRHYYTPQIFVLETLYQKAPSKKVFMDQYEPTTKTLPVFDKIHTDYDSECEQEALSQHETSESELSDIEMSPEEFTAVDGELSSGRSHKFGKNSSSFLNSTLESTNEDWSDNFALKNCDSPAKIPFQANYDDEIGANSEIDVNDVSLRSLGLDFV